MAGRIRQEILGVCVVLGSVYLAVCLATYDRWDRSLLTYSTEPVNNVGGVVGAYVSDILLSAVGVGAFAIPLFGMVLGIKKLFAREGHRVHLVGALLFVFSASVLGALMVSSFHFRFGAGGLIGKGVAALLLGGLSTVGAYIVSLALVLSSLILLSPVSLINLLVRPGAKGRTAPRKKKSKKKDIEQDESVAEDEPYIEPIVVEPSYTNGPDLLKEGEKPAEALKPGKPGQYLVPSTELLNLYEPTDRPFKDELLQNSSLLEQKLTDFQVDGRVTQVHTGPIVTMYEFEPAPGVKINRVLTLADDLALALKALAVRIAPIPGKAALGIEIPNTARETVSLREVLSSEVFRKSKSLLTLSLGKDIFGSTIVADLTRMPHLLVAGSTGSGKSVALNAMVLSILYKASPEQVKMLMIDPKLLELSAYDGIPHLIAPVVTNPKLSAEMLRKMVFEMERRYRIIAERGVRNIESFNAEAAEGEKLPYIVIFIDEFADLMFTSSSNVEDSIARLAQMARASGIHLVLATQRPSVDVITGVIKANFPARIAFHVTSKIDSRTIIDAQGAEQLIGKGDMLFMVPGKNILRVHGPLVTEGEVKSVVKFITEQGDPDFSIINNIEVAVARQEEEAQEAAAEEERDEHYARVVQYAQAVGEVSISSIQRKFKIGYNRAARIMDLLAEDGRVGPPRGAGKPRDFLG